MTGDYWIARDPAELAERTLHFRDYVERENLWPVCWKAKQYTNPRTLDQNAMIYGLYGDIAKQVEGESVIDIKRHCKLHFGVPILRADDPDFCGFYDTALKRLDYETKLKAMDYVPVTSLMNKKQGAQYIDAIIHDYSGRGLSLGVRWDA